MDIAEPSVALSNTKSTFPGMKSIFVIDTMIATQIEGFSLSNGLLSFSTSAVMSD